MKLSKRLQTIADLIPNKSSVIDVGCDHGLLSIYLANEKECNVIASDVNENALSNAKFNKQKHDAVNVNIVLSDGLDNIKVNKEDYLVIAGMGTTTITNILKDKKLPDNIIISTHNQLYELRVFVNSLGYKIVDEVFVDERGKKYIIIHFIKGITKYKKEELMYGPITIHNNEYLVYELEKLYVIKESLKNSSYKLRIKNSRQINKLLKLLEKMK